jgi:hypothetical protein
MMTIHNQARVIKANGRVYVDLADDRDRAVEIDEDGWRVLSPAPFPFLRTPSMLPLPIPEKGGTIDELREPVSVSDDHFIGMTAWVLDALRGDGVYPILTVSGSDAPINPFTMLRQLVDPSSAPPFSGVPRSKTQLSRANLGYLFAFDNMPEITGDISVALRRRSVGHPMIAEIGSCEASVQLTEHHKLVAKFEQRRPTALGLFYDAVAHGLRSSRTASGSLSPHAEYSAWFDACKAALWPYGAPKVLHKETPLDRP